MKKVLVLGGGGFIGRNIVEFLVNRGDCNVTAADAPGYSVCRDPDLGSPLNFDFEQDAFN